MNKPAPMVQWVAATWEYEEWRQGTQDWEIIPDDLSATLPGTLTLLAVVACLARNG